MSLVHLLVLCLIGGFALDFRRIGDDSTSYVQFLFVAVSLIGGLGILGLRMKASGGSFALSGKGGRWVFVAGILYSAWAPVALLAGTSPSHPDFLSVFLPYGLYTLTMLAVVAAINGGFPAIKVVRILTGLVIVSSIWRVLYSVLIGGDSLAEARWHILSPGLPLLLGASTAGLMVTNKRLLPMTGFLLFFTIVMLAVTRSYAFCVVAVAATTLLLARKGALPRGFFRRLLGPMMLSGGLLIASTLVAAVAFPAVTDRWTERLTGEKTDSGQEITLIVRIAEYRGQYLAFTESPTSILFGKGFGSGYEWDQDYLDSLLDFEVQDEEANNTRGSHSTWVYPTYAHGIIVGPLFILSLVIVFRVALRRCREQHSNPADRFTDFFALYCLASCYGVSFTSNLINERLGGIIMGSLVGIIIAARSSPAAKSAGRAPAPGVGCAPVDPQLA